MATLVAAVSCIFLDDSVKAAKQVFPGRALSKQECTEASDLRPAHCHADHRPRQAAVLAHLVLAFAGQGCYHNSGPTPMANAAAIGGSPVCLEA